MTYAELKRRARHNRKNPTRAEREMWFRLRNRSLNGWKFRRQHVFYPYIVDFYCPEHRLIFEINGGYHDAESDYENRRFKSLEKRKFTIVSVTNEDVLNNVESVLDLITRSRQ